MTNFLVSFGEVVLDTDSIWPDGDAPDDPTADDVVAVMRHYGPKKLTLDSWDLIPSVYVDSVEVWP